MANEKILNTRIILKNDTLAAFNDSTFIPKKGEMLLASIDAVQHNGQVVPTYLIKVGDGEHKFSELKYAAAQAADVYAWAKAASVSLNTTSEKLEFKDAAGNPIAGTAVDLSHFASDDALAALDAEVEGLSNRVDAIDTDTKYVFSIVNNNLQIQVTDKAGTQVGELQTLPLVTDAELTTILEGYVTTGALTTARNEINGAIADVDAKFANYTITALMNEEFAKYTKTENLDTTIDGYGYLKAADIADKADKSQLDNYYTKGEIDTKVEGINASINGVDAKFANYDTKAEVNTKISTALESYYDKGEVDGLIADLATAMNFVGVVDALPATANDGDVVVLRKTVDGKSTTEEYVWYNDAWQLLGDESLMGQVSERLTTAEGAIADIQGVVGDYSGTLAAMDEAIQANAKAIADNETDIEGKFSTLNGTVEGHTTTLGQHLEAINKNKDDIAALPASITISSAVVDGEYVSAISGNAKDGFTVSKASLSTVDADVSKVAATPGEHEMVVLTAVADNGTAGHTVKLQATEGVAVTKAGATAIAEGKATDAINALKANLVNNDAAVAGEFVTAAVQSNGLVTVSRRAVKIDELAQDTDTYVIFDCGSASKFI